MIVKVQVSLKPKLASMLIYNESGSVAYHGDLTPEIKRAMKDRPKVYFHAKLRNGLIELEKEAPAQEW